MDISKPSTTEESIIYLLGQKSCNGEELLVEAKNTKASFTKQALYQILRKLIKREIVVKYGKQFSLSKVYVSRMRKFFSEAESRYGTRREIADFLALTDGDKISYNFKNPEESDHFLAHMFAVLTSTMPASEPIYLYNPHEWFLLARAESEIALFTDIQKNKRTMWLIVGNTDPLDIYIQKYFDGRYLQCHLMHTPPFEKNTYYLNIYGTYVMEAYIDVKTAEAMDKFYKTTSVWNEKAEKELQKIILKGKTTITISRNQKKAEKLKKIFAPYFYKI